MHHTTPRHVVLAALVTLVVATLPACGKKNPAAEAAKAAGEAAKAAGEAAKAAGEAAKAAGEAAKGAAEVAAEAVGGAGAATSTGDKDGPQRVFFVTPKDGAEISGPADSDGKVRVALKFGVDGMVVKPAGSNAPNSGHHHVIIDGDVIPENQPVPMDERHIHYGKGQVEAVITLAPGKHKLTMQFANFAHLSYGARMSSTIEITVNVAQPSPEQDPTRGPAQPVPTGPEADKAAAAAAAAAGTPIPKNAPPTPAK